MEGGREVGRYGDGEGGRLGVKEVEEGGGE